MTQRSRWAFSRLALAASAMVAVAMFGAGSLLAQGTTGKIEGTVKDSSGAPIAGAQVLIVGSAFKAVSDEKGYYFINNVPAGVVTVRAQYIGYAPNEVRGVRVLADQTMTVNPVLTAHAVELGVITVTEEQNPIVPRDQVTSKPTIQGAQIAALPVDAVSQVLRLQPGVVQSNRGLSIRGSRPGEQATYIDGVLVRNYNGGFAGGAGGGLSNTSATTVGTNALEEASVTTGATGAAYASAQGGVVSLVTRAGGAEYHGSISYATDNVSGQVYGTGLNRIEASIGGPVMKNLTFYLATTLQGQQNGQRNLGQQAVPQFQLAGYFDSVMVPLNPGNARSDSQLVRLPKFTQYASGCGGQQAFAGTCKSTRLLNANGDQTTLDGKLQYTYGTGSRISLTAHVDRNQGLNAINYDPVAQTGTWNLARALIASWTQNLSTSSEHALVLDAALSLQKDQFTSGIVQPSWMEDHHNPFAFFNVSDIKFVTNFSSFPINDQLIENLRLNRCRMAGQGQGGGAGGCIPFIDRNDLAASSNYRFNPYGVASTAFASFGIGTTAPNLNQESRFTGRANLDWQANRYNRVQAGVDFTNFTDQAWTSNLVNQIFMDAYKASPKTMGLYGQDRIDLGDVVIELGLRYDHLNSGVLYPRVPGRVFTDPLRDVNLTLAQKLAISYNAQDSSMARACDAALAAADSSALATCNYFKADPVSTLSPSLRVSFPVTDRTAFRLSYAHQVQTPDMNSLETKTNVDVANTNLNDIFSRPLSFGKTILFEFGIRHSFSDDMVLDISAYNKDQVSEVAGRTIDIYDPFIGGPPTSTNESINLYTNRDFGNVRGIDFRLDRRFGSIFQGTLSYTYQTAKNTGSDPNAYLNTLARVNSAVTGLRLPPPQAILTTADNVTHTIAGNLAASFPNGWNKGTLIGTILENASVTATFRFNSGLAYTLMQNGGLGSRGPGNGFGLSGNPLEPINTSTMPWTKNVDMRVTRGFRVAGKDISVFADFRNLFNWKNLTSIFAETGDVVNNLYQANSTSPQVSSLTQDAGALWVTKAVTVNGVTQDLTGVDLSDCSKYGYGGGGIRGKVDCLMLQQDELRWGNGDQFFSTSEIQTAYNAWFNRTQGPQTFNGAGFNMRLGFEFNF